MGKFKVGDKVKVIAVIHNGNLEVGDIGELVEVGVLKGDDTVKVLVEGKPNSRNWLPYFYIELIEPKPSKKQQIQALEKRVEALEKLVEDYFKLPVEPSIDDVEDKPTPVKTPNQLRAEIIEKAKGYLEEKKTRNGYYNVKSNTIIPYSCKADFIVNEKKRTIVVLLRGIQSNEIYAKGIAKCNPSDVFNEHIGKAIALGRALGLDVSEFEGAVQPTLAVGQVIDALGNYTGIVMASGLEVVDIDYKCHPKFKDGRHASYYRIINDTNAIYGEVE